MKRMTALKAWAVRLGVLLTLLMLMFLPLLYPAHRLHADSTPTNKSRVVQVALATHPKISQYTDIDSSANGYGKNACGLVAAAAAVGGKNWTALVDEIARAAKSDYGQETGIQPSKYVAALRQVFGAKNVIATNNTMLEHVQRALQDGHIVIVNIKVNQSAQIPSARPPNYAHFARVLGLDSQRQELYIENTLRGAPYWTVSFEEFLRAWERPETTASLIPDPRRAENVTRWAVVLNGEVIKDYQAAQNL